jgi:hypothetical protein
MAVCESRFRCSWDPALQTHRHDRHRARERPAAGAIVLQVLALLPLAASGKIVIAVGVVGAIVLLWLVLRIEG